MANDTIWSENDLADLRRGIEPRDEGDARSQQRTGSPPPAAVAWAAPRRCRRRWYNWLTLRSGLREACNAMQLAASTKAHFRYRFTSGRSRP